MYLLDTNHCSLILQRNEAILKYINEVKISNIATSIVTVGELSFMAENSQYKLENLEILEEFLADLRIYYIDEKTAKIYGQIKALIIKKFGAKEKSKRKKITINQLGFDENDLWIMAIALRNNLTVVSADSDFVRMKTVIDFPLINWRNGS